MGGSSGVILAISSSTLLEMPVQAVLPYRSRLVEGLKRVSQVGGAKVGDRTMIDALAPALARPAIWSCHMRREAARDRGLNSTANIRRAKAGRAAYVPEENLSWT